MEANEEWKKTKFRVKYKFITSHGSTFKWMNPMALASMTHASIWIAPKICGNLKNKV